MVWRWGQQRGVTLKVMKDIAGLNHIHPVKQVLIPLLVVAGFTRAGVAQVYTPIFKSVEKQATIAPLGQMVQGDFFGKRCVAAISKSQKAIYFYVPDSVEHLILTNVVSLPDTPVAISKGREVVIEGNTSRELPAKLVVLMKPDYVALVSFGSGGQPEVSARSTVDPYCTGVRAVDMETSGKLDIIGYGKFSLGVSIEKNIGNGSFKSVPPMPGPLGNVPLSDVAFTDFNGDLVPDMAALDWVNRRLLIFYGRGDGTFAQPVSFQLNAEPSTLSVADLNGNGYPDIVVGYTRLPRIDIFGGDGFGRFFLRQTIKTAAPVSKFAIADFTGDGTMDIAALSRSTGDVMLYSYDPLSRRFQYSGIVGLGDSFDDVVPFYFPNRIKADLIASSPDHKYVKVFKSSLNFTRFHRKLVPVGASTAFISVCGADSANYLITANRSGRITARFSSKRNPLEASSSVNWQSEGSLGTVRVLSDTLPYLLVSYPDEDMLSLYEVSPRGTGVTEMRAETAFPPFAMVGDVEPDSACIVAAYRASPDSAVGISYFTAIKGKSEFLEHDYSVNDTMRYVSSAVTVSPTLSFLRIWRAGTDTLELECTSIGRRRTSRIVLRAKDARFLSLYNGTFPLLATRGNDSLDLYSFAWNAMSGFSIVPLASTPFDSASFGTIRIAPRSDSTYYMTYVNRSEKSVFLYNVADGRMRFVKAWHVDEVPADIALSPSMKSIYFLNRSQAYVSVHSF